MLSFRKIEEIGKRKKRENVCMHACEREERTSSLVYQIKKMFMFLFFYIRVIGRKGEIVLVLFPLFFVY